MLIGVAPNLTAAELENVPQLSNPGTLFLYHADIPLQNLTVTDFAIQNPRFWRNTSSCRTMVVGVNEIIPSVEYHEEAE